MFPVNVCSYHIILQMDDIIKLTVSVPFPNSSISTTDLCVQFLIASDTYIVDKERESGKADERGRG